MLPATFNFNDVDLFSFVDNITATTFHGQRRRLNHFDEKEDLLDNPDDSGRAEKDENGFCIHYEEDLEAHFARIAKRLRKGDETMVMDP